MVFLKEFFEKVDFVKSQQTTKKQAKLPRRQSSVPGKHLAQNDKGPKEQAFVPFPFFICMYDSILQFRRDFWKI